MLAECTGQHRTGIATAASATDDVADTTSVQRPKWRVIKCAKATPRRGQLPPEGNAPFRRAATWGMPPTQIRVHRRRAHRKWWPTRKRAAHHWPAADPRHVACYARCAPRSLRATRPSTVATAQMWIRHCEAKPQRTYSQSRPPTHLFPPPVLPSCSSASAPTLNFQMPAYRRPSGRSSNGDSVRSPSIRVPPNHAARHSERSHNTPLLPPATSSRHKHFPYAEPRYHSRHPPAALPSGPHMVSSPTSTRGPHSSSTHRSSPSSKKQRSPIRDRYHVTHPLGRGRMGTVFRATDSRDGTHVAIKLVKKRILRSQDEKIALMREVKVLQNLNHPFVLSFRHAFEDQDSVYIITEFCSGGDLYTYLEKSSGGLPERQALKFMHQLFKALNYLHNRGISHRDIKPENILMTDDGNIKLADFGLCHLRLPNGPSSSRHFCGTPQYAAPEIANNHSYIPEQSDMWSCGILFYALLTKSLPYKSKNCNGIMNEIRNLETRDLLRSRKLADVSDPSFALLRALLTRSPAGRPSAARAIELVEDAMLGPREYRSTHMPW
ncbi:unnamed protein product [Agarophyton chilense]